MAVTAAAAALIGTGTAGASAAGPQRTGAPAAGLSITVRPDAPGNALLPGFVGLSFGAATSIPCGALPSINRFA